MVNLALAALLAVGQTQTKEVANLHGLVSRDWSNGRHAISFQSGEKRSEGTAWLFRYDGQASAWKGVYKLLPPDNSEDDAMIVSMSFLRHYEQGKDGTEITWKLNTAFKPQGMYLEMPLEDSAVPDGPIQLSVLEGFWADEDGTPTTRTRPVSGWKGSILKMQEAVRLRSLPFVELGETMQLSPTLHSKYASGIARRPPPTFKPRVADEEKHCVLKPVTSDAGSAAGSLAPGDSASRPSGQPTPGTRETIASLIAQHQSAAAFRVADEWVRRDSQNPQAWFARGEVATRMKKYADGEKDLSVALALDPKNADCLLWRAHARENAGDFREAVEDYRALVRLRPKDPEANNGLAWNIAIHPDFGDKDLTEALASARVACFVTKYEDFMYIDTLAAVYARQGNFDPAVRAQREALRLAPAERKQEVAERLRLFEARTPYSK